MRLLVMAAAVALLTLNCCDNTDEINSSRTELATEYSPISGIGTVEGYAGYFSAALPPDGNSAYPSGYMVWNGHWQADSPGVAYWALFLQGKDNELRNAVYVKASGRWSTKPLSKREVYIDMIVDSLEVIERKGDLTR